jgi:hypothetical protein
VQRVIAGVRGVVVVVVVVSLGALLGGCAAKPSYVGKWQAENTPGELRAITLDVNADGTFHGTAESPREPTRFAGTWKADDAGKAVFTQHGEDKDKPGAATLYGNERMIVEGTEFGSIQFKRTK